MLWILPHLKHFSSSQQFTILTIYRKQNCNTICCYSFDNTCRYRIAFFQQYYVEDIVFNMHVKSWTVLVSLVAVVHSKDCHHEITHKYSKQHVNSGLTHMLSVSSIRRNKRIMREKRTILIWQYHQQLTETVVTSLGDNPIININPSTMTKDILYNPPNSQTPFILLPISDHHQIITFPPSTITTKDQCPSWHIITLQPQHMSIPMQIVWSNQLIQHYLNSTTTLNLFQPMSFTLNIAVITASFSSRKYRLSHPYRTIGFR